MARGTIPVFTLSLPLKVNRKQELCLDKKMNIAVQIYNTCLKEASKRLKAVLADRNYRFAVKTKQEIKAKLQAIPEKNRSNQQHQLTKTYQVILKETQAYIQWLERFYGYSEFDMFQFVAKTQQHFKSLIGSLEAQELASRAFSAVEKVHYRQAKRVSFKRLGAPMSVANKNNASGLRYLDGVVHWGKKIRIPVTLKTRDFYAQIALFENKLKYIRILKKEIRGKSRYFVQFILEGYPPFKPNRLYGEENQRVGLDIGISTLAVVSKELVKLYPLAPDIQKNQQKLRRIQRAMERSKRITNPQNFHENGVPKKGKFNWNFSKHYQRLKSLRKEIQRKIAVLRKQSHEKLANSILSLGLDIRVETMRFQGLQKRAKKTTRNLKNGKLNKKKRFGKSILNHAPAMFLVILQRKLTYQGKNLKKIDTYRVKASQFNHVTGEYQKKNLSDRWNIFDGFNIQRDLYSAFLIGNTTHHLDKIDVQRCHQYWSQFKSLHDLEINRIQDTKNKELRWFIKA